MNLLLKIKTLFVSRFLLKKNFAFTLAETLIVIGIIGVVASLTIPNLNSSTADREKVTKIKKVYADINEAVNRAQAVYGPMDEWFMGDNVTEDVKTKRLGDRVTEFMKLSKNCSIDSNFTCWGTFGASMISVNTPYTVVLSDGISLAFTTSIIAFKINGAKGKGKWGDDLFLLNLRDGEVTYLRAGDSGFTSDLSSCTAGYSGGSGCTGWVITNGNLDYLKADSSLKCSDGKTVLDGITNTSCK